MNTNTTIAPVDTAAPVNLVIGQPEVDPVESCRAALVAGAAGTGDLIRNYAAALSMRFDLKNSDGSIAVKWFDLIGADRKGIKAEREKFVSAMVERGFKKSDGKPSATVDTYWQRVKEASGYVPKGRASSATLDVDTMTRDDLKTVINRILKAEENGKEPRSSQHKRALIDVFAALGGKVDDLGKR